MSGDAESTSVVDVALDAGRDDGELDVLTLEVLGAVVGATPEERLSSAEPPFEAADVSVEFVSTSGDFGSWPHPFAAIADRANAAGRSQSPAGTKDRDDGLGKRRGLLIGVVRIWRELWADS